MQGFVPVWRVLSPAKRVVLVIAVVATIFVFSVLARTASKPPMSLLYAGLDPQVSGDVLAALDRSSTPYEIRGEAIYVPSSKRDAVRMSLAAQGLPDKGQAGYELLDKLNGFSTTSDMFDATYWRAKEGELARTILATPGVRAARVHIANPHAGPFSRNTPNPTAVVTITTGANSLSAPQAQAIRYLVSSAVSGLDAERVAVIDSERGVILTPGEPNSMAPDPQAIEDREQKMENDILNLLEARVGPGNARVQVALEVDTEHEAVSEVVYNPDGRVMSGKETTEISESSSGGGSAGAGGAVSVSSNLPSGDAGAGGGQSQSKRTETRETVHYDMSETKREREKFPGAIRKLSIAVFVNQIAEQEGEDGNPVLRSDEEIGKLKTLVANAVGLDETRGDTLTIQTLPFKSVSNDGVLVKSDPVGDFIQNHLMTAIQIFVLSIVTLILGLFVVKPLLMPKDLPAQLAQGAGAQAIAGRDAAAIASPQSADEISTLKEVATNNSDEAAALIKSWLETAEDAA